MDPNACFLRLLRAHATGDTVDLAWAYIDLDAWMAGGGFPPTALVQHPGIAKAWPGGTRAVIRACKRAGVISR